MVHRQTTKELLAASAFDLLEKKSMSEITVQDIIENCGVSRKTFYNHFCDKYQLFEWGYSKQLLRFFEKISPGSYTFRDALTDSLCLLKKNYSVLTKLSGEDMLRHYYEKLQLTLADVFRSLKISVDSDTAFLIEYTCFAETSFVSRWLKTGAKKNPETFASLLLNALPQPLAESMKQASIL